MRKTKIQLLLLLLAGGIIFWRELSSSFVVGRNLQKGLEQAIPPIWTETSSNSIIWLMIVAAGLVLLTEGVTRYIKMSSPNSV